MISHSLYPLRYRYVVGNISLLGKTKVANSAHIAHCNLFLQENILPSEKKASHFTGYIHTVRSGVYS